MTIALGILASDGVVVSADTELTWGQDRKSEGAKIAVWKRDGLAIAGAGNGEYIDAISERFYVAASRHGEDFIRIRRDMQAALVRFHYDHILPWSDPDLHCSFIIGLQRGKQAALWVTYRTTMRRAVCASIGIGASEADSLFVELFGAQKNPAIDVATAQVIAAYITSITKDRIPGCGKNTDIAVLTNGEAEQLSRSDMLWLESEIENVREVQIRAAQYALGYILTNNEKQAALDLASFAKDARKRIKDGLPFRTTQSNYPIGEHPRIEAPIEAEPLIPPPPKRGRKRRPPSRA